MVLPEASLICWSITQQRQGSSMVPIRALFSRGPENTSNLGRKKQQSWQWKGLYIDILMGPSLLPPSWTLRVKERFTEQQIRSRHPESSSMYKKILLPSSSPFGIETR